MSADVWVNFSIIVLAQLVFFISTTLYYKKQRGVFKILLYGIIIGTFVGLLYDLILGKYLGLFSCKRQ